MAIENKLDKYLNEQKHLAKFSMETRRMINEFDKLMDRRNLDVEKIVAMVDKLMDSAFEDGRVDAATHIRGK